MAFIKQFSAKRKKTIKLQEILELRNYLIKF